MIDYNTKVSSKDNYEAINFSDAFPGTLIGGNFTDAELWEMGCARISTGADYTVDDATQELVAITPTLNQDTKLWDVFKVQSLAGTAILFIAATAKDMALKFKYNLVIAAGFNYQGNIFQIDTGTATTMLTIKVQIMSGLAGPGHWPTITNSLVAFNDTDIQTFFNAAYVYGQAAKINLSTKRAALLTVTSIEQVNTIDETTGWPSN